MKNIYMPEMRISLLLFGGETEVGTRDENEQTKDLTGEANTDTDAECKAENDAKEESGNAENKRKIYDAFMDSPENREFFGEDVQRIINKRFKERREADKRLEELEGIFNTLSMMSGKDTVEEIESFLQSGGYVKRDYSDCMDRERLEEEMKAPRFQSLYNSIPKDCDISIEDICTLVHLDQIKEEIIKKTEEETRDRVISDIRARGFRPREGERLPSHSNTGQRPLTRADREQLARRVLNGEVIKI